MFAPTHFTLMIFHLLSYIATVYLIYTGSFYEWMIVLFLYVLKITISGTVTAHRLLSHKSFVAPKWFEYFGTLLLCAGGNGSTIAWVAIHREHHRHSDKEQDPHSPSVLGFFRVQFLGAFTTHPKIKYVPDLLRSKFHVEFHKHYWLLSLIYAGIVSLIDPRAILYAYFVPSILVWHGSSLINTLNHSKFGYRSYNTNDKSVNNSITGYLVSGEGWHNNHHHDPKNPKFGNRWYEFDLGWQIIKLIRVDK